MTDHITVGAASLMGALVAGTGLVRWAVTPPRSRGRHRAGRVVPLEELLGAPSEYTTPRFTDVPPLGVLTEAWRPCPPCGGDMPSVLHRDGWTCGACLTVSTGGAQ